MIKREEILRLHWTSRVDDYRYLMMPAINALITQISVMFLMILTVIW